MLALQPITFKDAKAFIAAHHRHHAPPRGWKFGVGCASVGRLVGIVTVGRPVARHYDDGWTLEVTRLCTDGTRNACSFLYAAAGKITRALGYRRLITYTLPEEGGASLKGAGWRLIGERGGGSWSRIRRPREDKHATQKKSIYGNSSSPRPTVG